MTHVQPQISSAPCTCCRARSVYHVADRYPPLSKSTCRTQSIFTFRINSSGTPIHPDLRCFYIILIMVQTWSRAVQVARPSPISIETPPYCSFVHTESDITHTNPRPGVTVSNLSILTGYITTSVSGSGSGLCILEFAQDMYYKQTKNNDHGYNYDTVNVLNPHRRPRLSEIERCSNDVHNRN